jgi:hypothetical protein
MFLFNINLYVVIKWKYVIHKVDTIMKLDDSRKIYIGCLLLFPKILLACGRQNDAPSGWCGGHLILFRCRLVRWVHVGEFFY